MLEPLPLIRVTQKVRPSCLWPSQRLRTYAPAHYVEEGMVVTFVFVSIAAAYCGDTIP